MSESKTHKKRDIFVEGAIAPAFVAESIAKHATQTSIGGHEIFLGQVRADPVMVSPSYHDTSVVAIAYTAYRDMANERMTAIREEAFARWPITCLHVHHSLGTIAVGELCFFVFASAAHRQPAREAVAFITDEVKKRLPIFGKEILSDDTHLWKRNA
ncbi:MAG: molybdenum cofactor biosynthesis protein MoaE [Flavobacteriales bacterium]|nr:molybdenum cofactor biosynthesis protein MoaE [Flavobacteriales bacterium]MBK7554745.1 molybdenum cofactor biosynthesis protein MoaE [Flavobacteriales bacterium]MBK9193470.1 molybdenum cofactor biosynthesis protein MoaE [Flavobacteriales bacterium]MBP6575528.1 molybdenum cofactor biosynthesis protein MoaE [Flavobacteriales bacterium]